MRIAITHSTTYRTEGAARAIQSLAAAADEAAISARKDAKIVEASIFACNE